MAGLVVAGASYGAYAASSAPAPTTTQRLPLPTSPVADADRESVTLGVRFTPLTDGTVTGVSFHRATRANTARVVQLWDAATRQVVATSAPLGNLSTGWVEQRFPSPVRVTAGHEYVASYLAPAGRYSATRSYWSQPRQTRHLSAPVGAGVYRYGGSAAFPGSTWQNSDYSVTPLFLPAAPAPTAPTTTAPAAPTTAPSTTAPSTTAPSTTAPSTSVPSTSVPSTPAPSTSASAPVTTAPPATSSAPAAAPSTSVSAGAPAAAPPATGTAPSTLMGWQINATNVGLAPLGLSCSSLPAYTGSLKPPAGARITGVRITGNLDLSNGDIVISRSCIQPRTGNDRAVVSNDVCGANECVVQSARSVTIVDSEIDASLAPASSIGQACAFRGIGTLQRTYMHGMGSGICFFGTGTTFDGLAEQNYVTGLRSYASSHNEAATIRDFRRNAGDTRRVQFVNNRLDCQSGNETGGLFIQPTWVDIYNVWVTGNYIEGGGFNLYLEDKGGRYGNVHATNNRFRSTGWGPAVVSSGVGWATWSENYLYSATAADAKGTPVREP
ncbi:DUF4082 domain-containing protein [Geodermatophilus sp. SYSU D01119]